MDSENEEFKHSLDLSEEIVKACKNHANLEAELNRTKLLLNKMKATTADVHVNNEQILNSLKTLTYLNENLNLDSIIKNNGS